MTAIVTHKHIVDLVISQRNAAVRTGNSLLAVAAAYKSMITSSVEKKNTLFSPVKIYRKLINEPLGEDRRAVIEPLCCKIDYLNIRKLILRITLFHRKKFISSRLSVIKTFYRWCSRSHKEQSIMRHTPLFRNILCIITRRGLGFIGLFALFVHNYKPDIIKMRKNSTSCTDNDTSLACFYTLELIEPLRKRKIAVHNGNLVSEKSLKFSHDLRRERNFGNEHYYISPFVKNILNKLYKNRGLSAARHSVKKRSLGFSLIYKSGNSVKRFLLFIGKNDIADFFGYINNRVTDILIFKGLDDVIFFQGRYNARRNSADIRNFLYRSRTAAFKKLDYRPSFFGNVKSTAFGKIFFGKTKHFYSIVLLAAFYVIIFNKKTLIDKFGDIRTLCVFYS